MTSKNPKTPQSRAETYLPSDSPGGFLPSAELDRANAFAAMRLALEVVLKADRNAVADAVRAAVESYAPEFRSHGEELKAAAALAESSGRVRDLENAVAVKVAFFQAAESATLSTAPRHASAVEIHARALLAATTAEADKRRVRYTNY